MKVEEYIWIHWVDFINKEHKAGENQAILYHLCPILFVTFHASEANFLIRKDYRSSYLPLFIFPWNMKKSEAAAQRSNVSQAAPSFEKRIQEIMQLSSLMRFIFYCCKFYFYLNNENLQRRRGEERPTKCRTMGSEKFSCRCPSRLRKITWCTKI